MTLLPINLPEGFELAIKAKDKVKQGDVLAQSTKDSDTFIEIAKSLEIPIRQIRNVLLKNPGDSVAEGDVLAQKKGFMGGAQVLSSISGTVVRIDEENGGLVIRGAGSKAGEKILSPVDGEVEECDNQKIVLKTDSEAFAATGGVGDEAMGEPLFLGEKIDAHELNSDIEAKIVIVGTLDRETLYKAIGLGASGIVVQNVDESLLESLVDRDINIPVVVAQLKEMEKFLKNTKKVMIDAKKKVIVRI